MIRRRRKAKGPTISELRWPNTPNFVAVAMKWRSDASTVLLRMVWQACDLLRAEVLSKIDSTQAEEDLERNITQLLEPRIHRVMSGDEPFDVQHGSYEEESRKPPPAQPPTYDIAFILYDDPRVMWPLEAKVLKTDKSVGPYVNEIKGNFLTCRYAPFSSEAGMIGYLFSGNPGQAFISIGKQGRFKLRPHPDFLARDHKTSDHKRKVKAGKKYPSKFRCHHLILLMMP